MDKVEIAIRPLREKEQIDPDAFVADVRRLAAQRGLSETEIGWEVAKPFPVDGAILILLSFTSKVAYDIWKEFILPELKKKYKVEQEKSGS
jgi:hypothetical protein